MRILDESLERVLTLTEPHKMIYQVLVSFLGSMKPTNPFPVRIVTELPIKPFSDEEKRALGSAHHYQYWQRAIHFEQPAESRREQATSNGWMATFTCARKSTQVVDRLRRLHLHPFTC